MYLCYWFFFESENGCSEESRQSIDSPVGLLRPVGLPLAFLARLLQCTTAELACLHVSLSTGTHTPSKGWQVSSNLTFILSEHRTLAVFLSFKICFQDVSSMFNLSLAHSIIHTFEVVHYCLCTQEDQPSLLKWLSPSRSHICGDEVLSLKTSSAHRYPDHSIPPSLLIVPTGVLMTPFHMSSIPPSPTWASARGTMHVCCWMTSAPRLTP